MAIGDILTPIRQGLSIREGQQARERENQARSLLSGLTSMDPNEALQSQEYAQAAALSPQQASVFGGIFGDIGEAREKALAQDARTTRAMLEANQPEKAIAFVMNRIENLQRLGVSGRGLEDTLEIAEDLAYGRQEDALNKLRLTEKIAVESKLLDPITKAQKPQDLSVGATVYGRDESGNPKVGNVVFDKANKKSWVEWADGGTTSIEKPSDAQKSAIRIAEAEKKAEIEGRAASNKLLTEERNKIRLDIYKTGRDAKRGINDLDRLQRAIDAFGTGKLEQFKLLAGSFIPGIDPTDPQAMQALLNKGVFPVLAGFSGAISEGERAFAEKTVANLGNTPEANRIIINHMRRTLQDEIDKLEQFKGWEKGGNKEHESFQFTPTDFVERNEADILKEYGL